MPSAPCLSLRAQVLRAMAQARHPLVWSPWNCLWSPHTPVGVGDAFLAGPAGEVFPADKAEIAQVATEVATEVATVEIASAGIEDIALPDEPVGAAADATTGATTGATAGDIAGASQPVATTVAKKPTKKAAAKMKQN
ncbi:hypothetical protein CYMTET_36109 [Cymbomonas tetramitiformis]|uniref:Uncharacterized protein n=1 Tax=Cymbomonas tetramitiformis TaxID=36881 RepID=A0AAE0CGL9_9CHLO|nr:hypothetical protein CYMTET_36109 [Cymbomonas tetramitiformis]